MKKKKGIRKIKKKKKIKKITIIYIKIQRKKEKKISN
jgi:hypothetical protein